jgi:hypothetical protein
MRSSEKWKQKTKKNVPAHLLAKEKAYVATAYTIIGDKTSYQLVIFQSMLKRLATDRLLIFSSCTTMAR